MINLCTQPLSIAKTADLFPGLVLSLNSNESNNEYLSANVSVLHIAAYEMIIYSEPNTSIHLKIWI